MELLNLHVPLADELGDADKVVVLQIKKRIRGGRVDQLVVDVGKVLVPAGLFGPSVLQRRLRQSAQRELPFRKNKSAALKSGQ